MFPENSSAHLPHMDPRPSVDSHQAGSEPGEAQHENRITGNSPSRRNVSSRSRAGLSRSSFDEDLSDFPVQNLGRGNSAFSVEGSGMLNSRRRRYGSRGGDSDVFISSQREMNEESSRLVHINDPKQTNDRLEFAGNEIRTSKYSIFTFLPRNLFEQFHRVAYIYFLVIAILNQIPQLAVFGRTASVLPLLFVLLVTAVKDAYEDFRRHRSDKIENNRMARVLVSNQVECKRWKEIRVGQIIKVHSNETLPCDMVLLSTSDPTGVAYVQTINLDGESNLKTRYAKQEALSKMPEKGGMSGIIGCENPNRNIYGFQAYMELDGKRLSLGPSNIVLRGCELKNTAWAVGVVVYAGQETKAMLNSSGAPSKRSRLETHMNRETFLLSLFLIALCSIVSTLSGIWLTRHRDELDTAPFFRKLDYSKSDDGNAPRNYNYYGIPMQIFLVFLMAVIVFQIMIPISLYISMELVRLGQAYFMIRDTRLYDETSDSRFQCRALNINEDLGQIKYVFSDKTGTLTENKMEFQCASIRGIDYRGGTMGSQEYNHLVQVNGQYLKPKMTVKANLELQELLRSGEDKDQREHAENFFLALAACNTIVPLTLESEKGVRLIDYQGESPDEQALVYAAAAHGYTLIERTSGHIVIDIHGVQQRFNILGLHEFDSDRKRMSVIVGCPDNTVKLFVKGADSSMLGIIDKSMDLDVVRATESHLHGYSSVGLRTLVVAFRELSTSEFERWQSEYDRASTTLIARGRLLRSVAANVESNLSLLGASAIEDKLQEGVPDAIESLRQAGIKVWVLTGDKQETAISIGYSSKLLTENMAQIIITSHSRQSCRKSLEDAKALFHKHLGNGMRPTSIGARNSKPALQSDEHHPVRSPDDKIMLEGSLDNKKPLALIIDGTSLVYILETEMEDELFQLATQCSVVLCCRVAPLQKAGIVAMIKNKTDDLTLAIGDGANDVSMIQMADVGIGISGQEGRQAVMASDFAMGQFRFLVPLLLVHGHWNYQRMGYMLLYNFYRNAVFVLVLFWYVLYTAYTLTTAITEWSSVLYSIIYTSLPTIVVGILDKDLGHKTLLKYPRLYGAGQRHESYNAGLFWLTMLDTLWQSAAIFYIPYCTYRISTMDASRLGDLWTLAAVIVVNLHLAMDIMRWTWITHAVLWGSILATCICVLVVDSIPQLPGFWAIYHFSADPSFWLNVALVLAVAVMPRFVVKFIKQQFKPSDIQISREADKFSRWDHLSLVPLEPNANRNTHYR